VGGGRGGRGGAVGGGALEGSERGGEGGQRDAEVIWGAKLEEGKGGLERGATAPQSDSPGARGGAARAGLVVGEAKAQAAQESWSMDNPRCEASRR